MKTDHQPLAYGEPNTLKKPELEDKTLGFRSIALVTLLLVLLLTAILSTFIGLEVRSTLFTKQQGFASLLAENLNHQIYRRFTLPTALGFGRIALKNPAQYERLNMVVQSTIHGLHVGRVRIFDHNSTVTYSTNSDEAGKTDLASSDIQKAMSSDQPIIVVDSKIPYWKAFFTFPLADNSYTLRTTYPLRIENKLTSSEAEGPIMGLLEFTQDITDDMEDVIHFQQAVVFVTLVSIVSLVILLFFFIRRSERAMAVRKEEEQRLLLELHQHEKLAGMGRVVASIAHEIRNPLGIIRSSAELLLRRKGDSDPVTSSILNAIYDESKRLSQTVSDFLDYAKPRQPKQDLVDVERTINQATSFLDTELTSREVVVSCTKRDEAAAYTVLGDSDLLYRVFYNIIANAMQAIGSSGTLTITLGIIQSDKETAKVTGKTADKSPEHTSEKSGGKPMVEVTFHDSGPGFPPEHLAEVLDPFFTTKDDGTGLGLPIVNNIIAGHDGFFHLSNAPEGGAVVRVILPQAKIK